MPFKVKYYEIAESFSHLVDFADKFTDRIAACVISYTHLDKISCLWLFTVTGEEYTAVNLGGVGITSAEETFGKLVKAFNKNCRIAIVSLKNYNDDAVIEELNKHLKYIADSEQCEFGDIAKKKVWNPQQTKELSSFLYSMGFARPLNSRHPLYDLIKIVFCFDADSEK